MSLRVLIVDDEELARSRLRTLLDDCGAATACVVGEAGNAAQALEVLARELVDVVLLDIHMPGTDGLQLAQALNVRAEPVAVVFVTAHADHAVKAFELDAVDYLTKPVRLQRLRDALLKVERVTHSRRALEADSVQESLVIHDRGRVERVPLGDVLYFKAELKYLTVRTAARSYIFDGALSELETRHANLFVRIHRNALVARRALRALEKKFDATEPGEGEGWAVRLHGLDEWLMVSRRQVAAVREALAGTT